MKDKLGAQDAVDAGLTTEVIAPQHPCPKCSKAMVDARTYEMRKAERDIRICSSEKCRAMAEWTSGSPVPYTPPDAPN